MTVVSIRPGALELPDAAAFVSLSVATATQAMATMEAKRERVMVALLD